MAVEFELPVLQISMAAVDKMQGPDALRALWTVFTKTTGALADGPRLENMTWRLWHRQLLLDRSTAPDDAVAAPIYVGDTAVEIVSDDDDSEGEWEDDSAPPSRDPTVVPATTKTDKAGVNTRRQSSTVLLQRQTPNTVNRPRRQASEPCPVLSTSQPTPSRPIFTIESRSNSSPDSAHLSHGTNIGRIISHLLPEKLEVPVPSLAIQSSISVSYPSDQVPSTPRNEPVELLIQSPSTPPNAAVALPTHLPPTLMVITPTPRPTPPATPSSRARAVPTNIPAALSPGTTPLALAAPSTLSQPHLVLLPCPSASDKLVPAAALPLTPTTVTAPELAEDDSKKKIFYVQSPEGAIGSDDGRSHSSSSNSNTTSNVTDAHAAMVGQKASSISSATTDEPVSGVEPPSEGAPPSPQDVLVPRGANHARTSSGNAAYTRSKAGRGVKASKPAARASHRGRPNGLVRTTSNSSDKSRGGTDGKARLTRQCSVSEEVVEDIEEVEAENKQASASTSHTVTSLPRASPARILNMTPVNNQAELPRNMVTSRIVSSPAAVRQTPSQIRSPPNMVARASLVAPFTTIASAAPTAPTAHDTPAVAPRPPPNNNSSALMGLGRRAVHVETSSDLESDSEESWSDDETDNEDTLARAANEAGRQRSMFEKITPRAPRNQTGTGLLTNLMNPDPRLFPQAAMRAHNSAQNLAALGRRVGAPPILQTSRSTVAVPKAAAVTADQVTTHVSVDPTGRAVGGSGSRGLRLKGRPQDDVDEEGSTEEEENSAPNGLSKTYAQRRLEALATRARVPPPPPMEQVRRTEAEAPTPALAPRPAPQQPQATMPYDMDVRPIHSPRTVRRKMIAGELSESLRRNLMWERTSTRFAMGAGAIGSGLRPLTEGRPVVQTTTSERGTGSRSGAEDEERTERRLALARNKSWANDFHHAGW